jgi:adenylate kinase family enzyme
MNGKKVISGFPGVGKSTVFNDRDAYGITILDSDSSTFDKTKFPANYIQHIKEQTAQGNLILCSSHDTVRAALVAEGIPFHLVFPALECKMEYLQRYTDRGSPAAFVDMMYNKWDEFIDGCMKQEGCTRTILQPGQFMCDVPELIELKRDVYGLRARTV